MQNRQIFAIKSSHIHISPCVLWPADPSLELVRSLRDLGQLEPVLVEKISETSYALITGYKRVRALETLKQPVLAVETQADDVQKGLLYLASNANENIKETPLHKRLPALRYFQPLLEPDLLAQRVAPALGLRTKDRTWRRFLAWLARFPEPGAWDQHLAQGRVPLDCVDIFERMELAEINALEPYFTHLRWSKSSAQQFLTALFESARAQGHSINIPIHELDLAEILERALSPKDHMNALLTRVREYRTPTLAHLKKNFARLSAELSAGTGWRLDHEHNFEIPSVTLTARVKNAQDLQKIISSLNEMQESPLWENLWRVGDDA